ncbi:MAG: BtpA/SgcQ family protein [Bacteroidota bacterium]
MKLLKLFKPVIGMIHVRALPGTPAYGGSVAEIIDHAVAEARMYREAGIDALALENMHDVPYLKRTVGPEISSLMAVVGAAVKAEAGLPCGLQILAGANKAALGAALAGGLDFIRAEGYVFGHLGDEGLFDSDAGELLRYRRQIGADHIQIFTDVKKKHSAHALTADVDLSETAKAAEYFRSDGIIITGGSTGYPADLTALHALQGEVNIPLLVGSGMTADNVMEYLPLADGFIVGSWFKQGGHWASPLDAERIQTFMDRVQRWRATADISP